MTAAPSSSSRNDRAGLETRRRALDALEIILCRGGMLHEAAHRLADLPPRERALAEQLVRTTLRRAGQLRAAVAEFLKRPLPAKACRAEAALLMGAAQLLFLRTPAHAALHTTVELARRNARTCHLAGLVNAVLRRVQEHGAALLERLPPVLNFPKWLRQRLLAAYGEVAVARMAEELVREPPLDITPKVPEEAGRWAEALGGVVLPTGSVRIAHPQGRVEDLPGYDEGAWWVQDAAAALPVRCMGDVAGKRVADLCAAPGGKTLQLAAAGARVTAVDISEKRLARLRENLARTHLEAEIVVADVQEWKLAERFDAVLLDAPCSATGTFRRHPDVLHARTPQQVAELRTLQAGMLERAASLVRPGGMLLYCVCSLLPEEGEEQVTRFLAGAGRDFRIAPIAAEEIGGLEEAITPEGFVRTLPSMGWENARGMDGFFIARLVLR